MSKEDLIYRLRKRAEIRRQIPGRKSVLSGEPDRIADLLEEAANALTQQKDLWTAIAFLERHCDELESRLSQRCTSDP